jgi:hypothetical protein
MSPKISTRFKQRKCSRSPPCRGKMVSYKMRKSFKKCCRKPSHKRIGPSRYKKNKWVKFLHKHSGHRHSRKSLKNMYVSYKKWMV